jgi:hypothetical protein
MADISLLDRYLQFVSNFLPSKGREDILAELRANLESEIDDRAASLGRPLTEDEIAAMLKQHGHPMAVASRYFPKQSLIGPAWIASYWLTLKLSLAAAAAFTLAANLFAVALDRVSASGLLADWLRFPNTALIVFAWVTLAFASIDFCSAKFHWEKSSWDPRKLPAIRLTGDGVTSRQKSMSDFIGALIGLLILLAFVQHWRYFFPANVLELLHFSHAWRPFYEICLASAIVRLIGSFTLLLRPDWYGIRPVMEVITTGASLIAFRLLLVSGPWVMVQPGGKYYPALGIANTIIFWIALSAVIGSAIAVIIYLWRCVKLVMGRGSDGAPAAPTHVSC